MPRTIHSNGVKSEIKALAVIELNKPVTPQEINDHIKTGDYAAKYVSMLTNTWGFTFTSQRDGRRVVSYTLVGEPDNAADLRSMCSNPPAVNTKTVKVKSAPKVKTVKAPPVQKNTNTLALIAKAAKKMSANKVAKPKAKKIAPKIIDEVEKEFGTSGSVGLVDADWEVEDGMDIRRLI